MPAHNFMLADLAGSLLAVCLFPLFILLPGFAIAWLTDLFQFRRRTSAFQLVLSIPLSIAICPIVTYLAGRFGSFTLVWALYAISWTYALAAILRHAISLPRIPRTAWIIAAAWAAIAIFSVIDLQIGSRAWFPSAAYDYSVRTEFIHAIGATGIPPRNPFYLTSHPAPLRYHYFWLLLCALVDRAGGALVSPRHAWFGGVVWSGFGFLALIALYFRLFSYRGPATFRRRAITGALLACVTGLDIVPTAVLWVLQAAGMHGVLPSGEWWNEQVDGFVYTAIWESHYLASLVACLMAFLILWGAARRQRSRSVLLGALALASAAGASVYLGLVFGLFLFAWTAFTALRKGWRETATLAAAGVIALLLIAPYAASLRGPANGGPALQLWVRPFYPLDGLFKGYRIDSFRIALGNLAALPLNYALELGIFLAAALVWYKKKRAERQAWAQSDIAIAFMIATSALLCTFLRSSVIGNNDLGWRGFLVAQFGLLLWAADLLSDWEAPAVREQRGFLTVLLILGGLGSAYEIAINRFYPLLADDGAVVKLVWSWPGRDVGARNYARREAAAWAVAATPATAVVQFNPHVAVQDTSALLYSDRQMLAADDDCLSTFGGDPAFCPALIATLNRIYPLAGRTAATDLHDVCSALPIDLIAAGDTDPAWGDRRSWVWNEQPAFANRYIRLFRCAR